MPLPVWSSLTRGQKRAVHGALFLAALTFFYLTYVIPPSFALIDRGTFLARFQVTPAMRATVVEALAHEMETRYVDAAQGAKAAARLRYHLHAGTLDTIRDTRTFTDTLTEAVRGDTHGDRNLQVVFLVNPVARPADGGTVIDPLAPWDAQAEGTELNTLGMPTHTDGVGKTATLAGNVGYVQIGHFFGGEQALKHFADALRELHGTRELVIDLRDNVVGEAGAAVAMAGLFFDQPTPVVQAEWRRNGKLEPELMVARPGPADAAYVKQPVRILTSRQTAGAAELFAWALQKHRGAKVLGESTRGGAHPPVRVRLDDHFGAMIPVGRLSDPATHADWERSGVIPDRYLLAFEALETVKRELRDKGEIGTVTEP
jgi:hypothetical protein